MCTCIHVCIEGRVVVREAFERSLVVEHVLGLKSVFPLFDCTISVDNTADHGVDSSDIGTVDIDRSYFIKLIYPPSLITKFSSLGTFLRVLSHSHDNKTDDENANANADAIAADTTAAKAAIPTAKAATPTASPRRGSSTFLNIYLPAFQDGLLAGTQRR